MTLTCGAGGGGPWTCGGVGVEIEESPAICGRGDRNKEVYGVKKKKKGNPFFYLTKKKT